MLCFVTCILATLASGYEFACYDDQWKREPRLYLNPKEILAPTAHGVSIIVDSTDTVVSETILRTGTWQPQLLYLISTLVQSTSNTLNIGAQLGLEAIIMAKLSPKGKAFVFEPYSVSYRMLVKSIYINGLAERVTAYRLAAGARSEELKLKIDRHNTGHSHIHYGAFDAEDEFEAVRCERVDVVVPKEVSFDFALIDVQSHEVETLLGMRQVLRRSPSLIVVLEWNYLSSRYLSEGQVDTLLEMLIGLKFRWVRYSSGEKCKKGVFSLLNPKELFSIKTEDLLLVGPAVNLTQKFGIAD